MSNADLSVCNRWWEPSWFNDSTRYWIAVLFNSSVGICKKASESEFHIKIHECITRTVQTGTLDFGISRSSSIISFLFIEVTVCAFSAALASLKPYSFPSDLNQTSVVTLLKWAYTRTNHYVFITSTPSTFPREISTCDKCWKRNSAVDHSECKINGENFPTVCSQKTLCSLGVLLMLACTASKFLPLFNAI